MPRLAESGIPCCSPASFSQVYRHHSRGHLRSNTEMLPLKTLTLLLNGHYARHIEPKPPTCRYIGLLRLGIIYSQCWQENSRRLKKTIRDAIQQEPDLHPKKYNRNMSSNVVFISFHHLRRMRFLGIKSCLSMPCSPVAYPSFPLAFSFSATFQLVLPPLVAHAPPRSFLEAFPC